MGETLQYPEYKLDPDAIKDTKKIYDEIRRSEIQSIDLAKILGYSGPTSGKFYERLNSMLMYGLLEGRGRYRVTELGKDISYPMGDESYKKSLYRKAVLNVPLWRNIYDIHKKDLPDNFWYVLKQITNADAPDIHKQEDEIRKRYLEDVALLNDENRESQEPRKSYNLDRVDKGDQMTQQIVPLTPSVRDTGFVTLNVSNQPFNISVFNAQSLSVAIATLNMLAEKFGLLIKIEDLPKEQKDDTKKEDTLSLPEEQPSTE